MREKEENTVQVVYFEGKKFPEFHVLEKIMHRKQKKLYGSYNIFDRFVKI